MWIFQPLKSEGKQDGRAGSFGYTVKVAQLVEAQQLNLVITIYNSKESEINGVTKSMGSDSIDQ